jgi:methylase of polypeptide subunit release factors
VGRTDVDDLGRTEAGAPEPGLVDLLRRDLQGFTVDALAELLGDVATRALAREQLVPAALVARRHQGEPLATLLAAFVLGRPVEDADLRRALPGLGVDGAAALGLVDIQGDQARPTIEIRPHAAVDDDGTTNWWLVSDLGDTRTGAPLRPDHVLGAGGASTTLARSTIRTRVARLLDVGTGCGVQALHAARHAAHVTGTDTSPRALAMAALNWRLNASEVDGTGLDLRRGSLLEPVRGETFDLVVSNPPFVISPRTGYGAAAPTLEYRDAGFVGDTLVQRLLSGIPDALAPGGVAQLLGNWELRRGETWTERVAGWLDDGATSGLDAWVVQREVQDPAEYVELWLRDAGQHAAPDADERYAAWLADFEARGVEAVGFGLLTLRRPADGGPPSLRRLEERRAGELPAGDEIAAALRAHDWLHAHDDAALLDSTLQVAPGVTEERHHLPGAEEPAAILLRHGAEGRVVQVSTAVAGLVGACDGTLTVGRIAGALATLLERPATEVTAEVLPAVRGLVTDGLLVTAP